MEMEKWETELGCCSVANGNSIEQLLAIKVKKKEIEKIVGGWIKLADSGTALISETLNYNLKKYII